MSAPASVRTQALRGGIFLVVLAVAVGLLLANAFGKFDETVPATAQLDTAGGALEIGAEVKLDGIVVGKVDAIEPAPRGVEVSMQFDPEQAKKVPGNATVRVLPVSIFGAAYVELLRPTAPRGVVTANAALKQDASAETIELGDLLEETQALVDALGPAELATMLETFASTLDGKGDNIGTMIETANRAVSRIEPYMPLIRQDIRLATVVMSTFSRITPNLFTALDGVMAAGQTLVDMEKEFQSVLAGLTDVSTTVDHVVTNNREALQTGLPYLRRTLHALFLGRGDIPALFAAVIALADNGGKAFSYGPFMRIDANLRLAPEDGYGPGDCPTYAGLRGRGC
ncbi:MCE family protein [Nocardioides sp. Root151]|uniref:MCE family protein n=1 Tax=Nocardioides sp. Root151 TaxID=1736475 RepID=UPI0009E91415|nr:MCE family protein [Nocardioides sp. Root151]